MSEKYLHFKTKACGKEIFVLYRRSNWIHILQKYFSNYVYLKDMYKNLNEIGIIQVVSKLTIFVNLVISEVRTNKKFEIMKPRVQFFE